MFSLNEFLMHGFIDAVGQLADYQIILNATGWYEKGVLTEDNLSELQTLIDEKNIPSQSEDTLTPPNEPQENTESEGV